MDFDSTTVAVVVAVVVGTGVVILQSQAYISVMQVALEWVNIYPH